MGNKLEKVRISHEIVPVANPVQPSDSADRLLMVVLSFPPPEERKLWGVGEKEACSIGSSPHHIEVSAQLLTSRSFR